MAVERKEYFDKLVALKDKQIIKVVTGVRRCGKSTLLEMFQDYLKASGVDESHIIAINFEDYDYNNLLDPQKLHAYVKERIADQQMYYIFFDEIQNVEDFPRVVDSLYLKKNVDMYITGSNAYMLSSEIATLISGRYIEIPMLPFSFREYVLATGTGSLSEKYAQYLQNSSMPYALELLGQTKEIRDYLESVYNTIVIKDVVSRKKIGDPMILQSVTRFMFDNIGSSLSTKKIADTLTSEGRKIDVKTVEKYVDALVESFVLYRANRYNVKGRAYLKTQEKYYVVDIGLRHALLGSRSVDVGHILENIVYLELVRRGYEVYVGKVDDGEVDFVVMDENKSITYYQVSASVRDENTLNRELKPLTKIADHYPKYILTLDDDPDADYNGIKRINALKWLLN